MSASRSWVAAALALACTTAAAGCGSSDDSSTATTAAPAPATTTDPAVAKMVPPSIKSKGLLAVVLDATYAPNEFFADDGKKIIGMEPDLLTAMAGKMGLKVKLVNEPFDGIIPGLAAKKYDIGASSFTDTKEREKVVDFVDFFKAGQSFYTKASGGTDIAGIEDTCGKKVAVQRGSIEEDGLKTQAGKCRTAGKSAPSVLSFVDQNSVTLAVNSGRAQLGFADQVISQYTVKKSGGQLKAVGTAVDALPSGIAVTKDGGLAEPLLAALKAVMSDGSYMKILTKWGVQDGAISGGAVKINGAVS
jgi:polar amino acid transport system substrate-binding protein